MASQSDPARPAVPEHLAAVLGGMGGSGGADPFAAASVPVARARRELSVPDRSRSSAFAAADTSGDLFGCPCSCGCGNDTTLLASKVTSATAARMLRCVACAKAGHLGLPVVADKVALSAVAAGKAGLTPKVRPMAIYDAEDAELDRIAARDAEAMRRAAAKVAFEASLPEKFRRPLDAVQEPAVEDRLRRLASGRGGHQLSLLTYGPYGSGKTWVGYSYARCAVERNLLWPQQIKHGTEAEIMEPLVFAPKWEVADRMKALLNPQMRMILIDDVGNMGRWPDVATRHATYASVVNWCWENNRALILTTNKDMGQGESLEEWIGVAAYERVRNMVGRDPVFRVGNQRATMQAKWEAEYQAHLANEDA